MLQPSFMIFSMIAVLGAMLLFVVLSGPIILLFRFLIRSVIGAAMIFICNFLLSGFGIYIGVNVLTAFFVGFLGFPGLLSLVAINCMLAV